MSGGSWDYLYLRDPEAVFGDIETMEAVRKRLIEHGIGGAILCDLEELISHLRAAHAIGTARTMTDVLYELEWHDSGDHSIHVLRHAVWRYNGCPPCTHEECTEPSWIYTGWEDDKGRWCSGDVYRKNCLSCGSEIVLERKNIKVGS